jgi:SPP1 Gp6-like portal protein
MVLSLLSQQSNVVPGIDDSYNQSSLTHAMALTAVENGALPQSFPMQLWSLQQARYKRYWDWYDGTALDEKIEGRVSQSGETLLKFPLQINAIRDFADKHAMIVLGETEETHNPLINPIVYQRPPLDGSEPTEELNKKAALSQNILREVWTQSSARSIQVESMKLAQALGGTVLKATWQPWKKDLRVPVVIEKVLPDHFLPVWNPKDYLDLEEVYEVYRIPGIVANRKYGINTQNTWVVYYEHWTKQSFSIYVDGKPLVMKTGNTSIIYKNRKNPWGIIPYVYLPAIRDGGSFYGRSFIPQVEGLLREYNSRMADSGDAVRDTVHRKRYMKNVSLTTVAEKRLAPGIYAIDVGSNAINKAEPDVWTEDPPNINPAFMNFASKDLWEALLRMGNLSSVPYGEDEGSQRSALTMSFRMWPATSRATQTRTFWEDGLNRLDYIILLMVAVKSDALKVELKEDDLRNLQINQQWHAMIPRDREQLINELVLLLQAGAMSPDEALERRGDVRDSAKTLEEIKNWLEFKANLGVIPDIDNNEDLNDRGVGSGASTDGIDPGVEGNEGDIGTEE